MPIFGGFSKIKLLMGMFPTAAALTPTQKEAVKSLCGFFDGSNTRMEKKEKVDSEIKDTNLPNGYVRVNNVLTNAQKKEIDSEEQKIEEGFKKNSAY